MMDGRMAMDGSMAEALQASLDEDKELSTVAEREAVLNGRVLYFVQGAMFVSETASNMGFHFSHGGVEVAEQIEVIRKIADRLELASSQIKELLAHYGEHPVEGWS